MVRDCHSWRWHWLRRLQRGLRPPVWRRVGFERRWTRRCSSWWTPSKRWGRKGDGRGRRRGRQAGFGVGENDDQDAGCERQVKQPLRLICQGGKLMGDVYLAMGQDMPQVARKRFAAKAVRDILGSVNFWQIHWLCRNLYDYLGQTHRSEWE